jgi:hypothetical protein
MFYTLTRVSPGSRLQFPFDSEHNLSAQQLVEKSRRMLKEYYYSEGQQIIEDFCHTFTNLEPKYGLLVFALDVGYGIGIINYEAFIVKPKS